LDLEEKPALPGILGCGGLSFCMQPRGDMGEGLQPRSKMMSLNLHHPGWFYFIPFYYHYRKNEYEKARIAAKQINMPYYQRTRLAIAVACGQLQRKQEAAGAIHEEAKAECAKLQ